MSRPLTALLSDRHRLLRGLLIGVAPTRELRDTDSNPMLVLIQFILHSVHEEQVLLPLIEQSADGVKDAFLSEGLSGLERCLLAFEREEVGSAGYEVALTDLRREFERHADDLETRLLPAVDERIDVQNVEPLRDVLGPSAAALGRLPDQVRRELSNRSWPRPGLARTLRALFETQLRKEEQQAAGH